MERREFVTSATAVGVGALSGCGAIGIGGEDEDQAEIKRVKTEAESPTWDELMRRIDEWEGRSVHYPNVHVQSMREENNGSYILTVDHPDYGTPGTDSLHCDWFGDRVDSDYIDIWGTVEGTHTYSVGDENTVPDVSLVEIQPS
ncbi:hypothetical protein HZS55_16440 [Halosimplex rubrum]|uniref:Uncharacterized protein n=1 Tax=Halosimplex rubrum TaxID=869889 RepID=A0A7D5P4C7_9EURY|nr:hypothetical protein [Halosimplex rubrum]QLH78781.1 hypothetical protein HZS55_16440 [Halosimplex rubrum]